MKNKNYTAVIFLIVLSLLFTSVAAYFIGREDIEQVAKTDIDRKDDENTSIKKKKNKKKKFEKNELIDLIVPKEATGKSAEEVGEKLSNEEEIPVGELKDGTYQGSARGYEGNVTVEVTISGGKIVDIQVISHHETPGYYERAFAVINRIIQAQTVSVDAVSGATVTSRAIMVATARAIKQAIVGGDSSGIIDEENLKDQTVIKQRELPLHYSRYKEEKVLGELNIDLSQVPDGKYIGRAEGFNGINSVSVIVEGGKITSIEIKHRDDYKYFSPRNQAEIIRILKNSLDVTDAKDIDSISNATYSTNSIIRAVKSALKNFVNNSIRKAILLEGISLIFDPNAKEYILEATNNLPLVAYVDGIPQNILSNQDGKEFIRLDKFSSLSTLKLEDYQNNELYNSNISDVQFENIDSYIKPTILKHNENGDYKLIGFGTDISLSELNEDVNIENQEIVSKYAIENKPMILILENQELNVFDVNKKNKFNSFVLKQGRELRKFVLINDTDKIAVTRDLVKKDLLIEQIKQWRNLDINYLVKPPLPDAILTDGKYYGYGYGYKAGSDRDRWRSEVDIRNGKVVSVKILNQPDDGEYVENAKNYKEKLQSNLFKDLRKLINLHVQLEKFYAVEPSIENKFNKKLPTVDGDIFLQKQRGIIRNIESDAVTGATISVVGMTRSVINAINNSILAGDTSIAKKANTLIIKTYPKKNYKYGETLDLSDLVVNVGYNNGTEKDIPFSEFANENITINAKQGQSLAVGDTKFTIRIDGLSKRFTVSMEEKPKEIEEPKPEEPKPEEPPKTENNGYVYNLLGNYDAPLFARPPEIGSKYYDGVYIGHGTGYYFEGAKEINEVPYEKLFRVQLTVKGGKVSDVRLIRFGDDSGTGTGNYYIKADDFKNRVFDLVKNNTDQFIKTHLKIERYMTFRYGYHRRFNEYLFPQDRKFDVDEAEDVKSELREELSSIDVISGATFSCSAYSKAIADALYKASKNEKQINNMYLSDFDSQVKLIDNVLASNEFHGQRYDVKRQFRIDNNYHQQYFYGNEEFDATNFKLFIEYTDGTTKEVGFDELSNYGYKAMLYDAGSGETKELVPGMIIKKSLYKSIAYVIPINAGINDKFNFVNYPVYALSDKPVN